MPTKSKKTLTDSECKERLIEGVTGIVEEKLTAFQSEVCGPRILLTNKIDAEINQLHVGQATLQEGMIATKSALDIILHRLDNVSANGNKGLEASLKDIYEKHTQVHEDIKTLSTTVTDVLAYTKPSRDKQQWYALTKEIFRTSVMGMMMSSKAGRIITFIVVLLVINTILHTLNIQFDFVEIMKGLFKTT